MSLTSNRQTYAALLMCAAACTASTKPDEVDIDFEFECGELDFYDLMSLVVEDRLYEVACGAMPEGYPDLDLDWRELASEYRSRGRRECTGNPTNSDAWEILQDGCAKDASVSLSIRAYRAANCPMYELVEPGPSDPPLSRTAPYYVGNPHGLSRMGLALHFTCYPSEEPQE
jgi:hypothetical protein